MTTLGVFRDDFYNAMAVLSQNQYTSYSTAGAYTIPAASIAGAQEVYFSTSGPAANVNYTTDTAANIIARLQTAVIAQLQASGNLQQAPGTAPGIPNTYNISYFFSLINTSGFTVTLVGGSGVTISGTATTLTATNTGWLVTVTGPNTVTFQRVGSGTN